MTDLEGGRKFASSYGRGRKVKVKNNKIWNYQHPAMFVLNPLEELEDTVLQQSYHKIQNVDLNVGHEDSLLWSRVALPPVDGLRWSPISGHTCRLPGRRAWRRLEEYSCPLRWQPRATENFKLIPGRRFQLRT